VPTDPSSGLFVLAQPGVMTPVGTLRRFTLTFLVVLSLISTAFLWANYVINPDSKFPTHVFTPLIPDFRGMKLRAFDAQDPAPRTLLLGTSTFGTVRPSDAERFDVAPAFNFATLGGSVEDVIASYRYAVAKGKTPSSIIVGLDYDALAAGASTFTAARLFSEMAPLLSEDHGVLNKAAAILGTLRPHYVYADAKVLLYTLHGYPEPVYSFDRDGLVHYVQPERALAAGVYDYDTSVARDPETQRPHYDAFAALETPSALKLKLLDALLKETRGHGTTVHLVLPPVHPMGLAYLEGTRFPAYRQQLVSRLVALCGEGVHLSDATEVASWHGDTRLFTDLRHFLPGNSLPFLTYVYEGPDLCRTASPGTSR
jgi:hypothetical protein